MPAAVRRSASFSPSTTATAFSPWILSSWKTAGAPFFQIQPPAPSGFRCLNVLSAYRRTWKRRAPCSSRYSYVATALGAELPPLVFPGFFGCSKKRFGLVSPSAERIAASEHPARHLIVMRLPPSRQPNEGLLSSCAGQRPCHQPVALLNVGLLMSCANSADVMRAPVSNLTL